MRRVAIVGIGATKDPGSHYPLKTWKEVCADAVYEAIADTNGSISPRDIEACAMAYHGEGVSEQGGIGGSVADLLGIAPAAVFPTCMNCCGGEVALSVGWSLVASERYDCVLVFGFDKESDQIHYGEAIQVSFDTEYDYMFGFTHRNCGQLQDNYYNHRYGYDYEPYARLALQDHWYARRNPRAHFYGTPMMSWERAMRHDSCKSAMGEGAAAAILVPADRAKLMSRRPVYISGVTVNCTSHYMGHRFGEPSFGAQFPSYLDRADSTQMAPLYNAARSVYHLAGIGPDDINFAQVYDLLGSTFWQLEAMGICAPGEGGKFIARGGAAIDGRCPTCTDGGNIARGHCSGADGVNQLVESVIQLRGEAGERQVPKARYGINCVIGGFMAQVGMSILTNE